MPGKHLSSPQARAEHEPLTIWSAPVPGDWNGFGDGGWAGVVVRSAPRTIP